MRLDCSRRIGMEKLNENRYFASFVGTRHFCDIIVSTRVTAHAMSVRYMYIYYENEAIILTKWTILYHFRRNFVYFNMLCSESLLSGHKTQISN